MRLWICGALLLLGLLGGWPAVMILGLKAAVLLLGLVLLLACIAWLVGDRLVVSSADRREWRGQLRQTRSLAQAGDAPVTASVAPVPRLQSCHIEDDYSGQLTRAIEVTLHFSDGQRRWCCFVRPQALAVFGDTLGDSGIRLHYGAPHMIVVDAELNSGLILQVLRQLDAMGELGRCSLPC